MKQFEDYVILAYGKYKGKTYRDVFNEEKSYCDWVINNCECGALHSFMVYIKHKRGLKTDAEKRAEQITDKLQRAKEMRRERKYNSINPTSLCNSYLELLSTYPELSNWHLYARNAFYIQTPHTLLNFHIGESDSYKISDICKISYVDVELYNPAEKDIVNREDDIILGYARDVNYDDEMGPEINGELHLLGYTYFDSDHHEKKHIDCSLVADGASIYKCLICGFWDGDSIFHQRYNTDFASDRFKKIFKLSHTKH